MDHKLNKEHYFSKFIKMDFTFFILFLMIFPSILLIIASINFLLGSEDFGLGLLIGSSGIFIPGLYIAVKYYLEKKKFIKTLSDAEKTDKLTGLVNFSCFREAVKTILNQKKIIVNNKRLGVTTISIDRLKIINNALGYVMGDEVIIKVKDRIQDILEKNDFLSRQGNFFLIYSYEDESSINKKLTVLLDKLQSLPITDNNDISLSVSIGFAFCDSSYIQDEDSLLKKSEIARDYAKRNGGNQYLIYNDKMETKSLDDLFLENELKEAINKDEIIVHYQPKIDSIKHKITGAEALVRWKNSKRGYINPDKFISIAEDIGMIHAIGDFVIDKSIQQLKIWEESGYKNLTISVNVSAKQFKNCDLPSIIRDKLHKYDVSSNKLELEITESLLIEDRESTIKTLKEIKSIGIQISIDDFGTKYSSLQYLKDFPVNTIKIDRNFVNGLLDNKHDSAIVSSIILLSNRVGYNVIAEGVENESQLKALNAEGCYMIQGYLFSKPLPPEDFIKYMEAFENKF